MPSQTPYQGLPFPVPGDTLYQTLLETLPALAAKIEACAVVPPGVLPTAPDSAYPVGISAMSVGSAEATGWTPKNLSGFVVTIRRPTGSAAQLLLNRYEIWYRNNLYSTWDTWYQVYGPGTSTPHIGGLVSVTLGANGKGSATVTFPSGMFATDPSFQVTPRAGASGLDGLARAVAYTNGGSSAVIWAQGTANSTMTVYWTATGV